MGGRGEGRGSQGGWRKQRVESGRIHFVVEGKKEPSLSLPCWRSKSTEPEPPQGRMHWTKRQSADVAAQGLGGSHVSSVSQGGRDAWPNGTGRLHQEMDQGGVEQPTHRP